VDLLTWSHYRGPRQQAIHPQKLGNLLWDTVLAAEGNRLERGSWKAPSSIFK